MMRLYELRIWGKDERNFSYIEFFSDCVPFDLDTCYRQEFYKYTKQQSKFLVHVIYLIQTSEGISDAIWLEDVSSIGLVEVRFSNTYPTISKKDLN